MPSDKNTGGRPRREARLVAQSLLCLLRASRHPVKLALCLLQLAALSILQPLRRLLRLRTHGHHRPRLDTPPLPSQRVSATRAIAAED